MDFNYSVEQRMLADSLRRFIDSVYTFARRRRIAREGHGFDRDIWASLANMGVCGLTVPAEFGGYGEGAASQLVVQRELGRGLVLEPVIPSAVMATAILAAHGTPTQQTTWFPAMASGERVLAVAYLEPDSRYRADSAWATATRSGEGYVLDGVKSLVWHGEAADAFLVSARLGGEIALFLVPRDAPMVVPYPAIDGTRGADLRFDVVRLGADSLVSNDGLAALQHGLDHGIAAQCAAASGAMERLIEMTAEYLRTRRQFGIPLAALQALQHRMADMLVQKEIALSMAYVAAQALDEADSARRQRMLAGAKVTMTRAARFVGQQAVQLHGGMGMTDELEVGDYFKFLTMADILLGDADFHLERYGMAMVA
nr:acyl-CoA dehydrogenase [uncultured Cupriavidus sp.]